MMAERSPHPTAACCERDGRLYYASGIDYPTCNGVIDLTPDLPLTQAAIASAVDFFTARQLPFMWWPLCHDCEALERTGFQPGGTMKGIVLELAHWEPKVLDLPAGLAIREVCAPEEQLLFMRIMAQAFGMNPGAEQQMAAIFQAAVEQGDMHNLMAYVDDVPVATVTLSTCSSVGGLWDGACLPDYRRRGILTALLQAALQESRRRGQQHAMAILMPKGMARGPTQTLGMVDVSDHPFYLYGATGPLE